MGREGSGSCIPGEAWLGMYTRGLQPDVKCFKIYQCLAVEGRGEKPHASVRNCNMDLECQNLQGLFRENVLVTREKMREGFTLQ